MKSRVMKPDLKMYFAAMPIIGIWLNKEYEKAQTFEEIANLFHKWQDEAENTTNPVKKEWLRASSNYIYSFFTGRSYECKKFQSL